MVDPPTASVAGLRERLAEQAMRLGFLRMGVARATELKPEGDRLNAWLEAGYAGEMAYMKRTAAVRRNPQHEGMLSSARSIVVLAYPFANKAQEPINFKPGRIARYAHGRDYHRALQKPLRHLCKLLTEEGHRTRSALDTMPVFERAWAERAGVGFIGKNCCLIVPGYGSHVFLAALVTEAELPIDQPIKEGCGSCTRCLDVCPTQAFQGARRLDARRCISYLTIEHRGPIEEELRASMGDWVFGCDLCQDVCPYNQSKAAQNHLPLSDHDRAKMSVLKDIDAETWLDLSEDEFAHVTRGSPLKRPRHIAFKRNILIALGNMGKKRHLPIVGHMASHHPSALLREHAEWARVRLENRLKDGGETID